MSPLLHLPFLARIGKTSEGNWKSYKNFSRNQTIFSQTFFQPNRTWASPQSKPIPNRQFLEENENKLRNELDQDSMRRPENWGGYRLLANEVEFWQGRPSRLHDRILYTQEVEGIWKIQRLAP